MTSLGLPFRRHVLALALALFLGCLLGPPPSHAEILRFREVEPGQIFRGSQPESLGDFALLQKHGIRTIINLKTTRDEIESEELLARAFGIEMISRPTGTIFGVSNAEVDEIQRLLNDRSLQPVFIHCRHGKDRTGLMVGVYRVETQGWQPDAAYDEMQALGFNPLLIGLRHRFWDRMAGRGATLLPLAAY